MGHLTINTDQTLTITAGQTVVFNPGFSVYIYGHMAMTKTPVGGQMRKGLLWYIDEDDDGLADSMTQYVANSTSAAESMAGAPEGSAKRRSHSDFTTSYDNNLDLMAYGWIDGDSDNYPYLPKSGLGFVLNTSSAGYRASVTNPTSQDCNDADATRWRLRYTDADGDGHCPNANTTCVGSHSGYRDSCTRTDDCCDVSGGNTTFVGQTSYFTSTNACASWDYNCSGAPEKNPNGDCYTYTSCTLTFYASGYWHSDCTNAGDCYTKETAGGYALDCGQPLSGWEYFQYGNYFYKFRETTPYDCIQIADYGFCKGCRTESGTCGCRQLFVWKWKKGKMGSTLFFFDIL